MKDFAVFWEKYLHQLQTEADRLMTQPMPELTEELFSLFEQTGSRTEYENVYFARRKFLMVFGIKALAEQILEGEVSLKTRGKLESVLTEICREECWAVPAHLSRKHPDWRITIDLFAAETAQTLAELYHRLGDILPQALRMQIRENVENRVLNPFLNSEQYGWEKSDHNWNAVCTGSIGSACIHLWGKSEQTDQCVARVRDSLMYYLGGFADDGTCMEGCSYYTYGMCYFVNFALELLDYTGGETDLLRGKWGKFGNGEEDKRSRIAVFQSKCFFPDGTAVNFSDGSRLAKYNLGLMLALKRHYPGMILPELSAAADLLHDRCYRFVFRKLDLLEGLRLLQNGAQDELNTPAGTAAFSHILPDAQWCIAGAENGVGFACKGGHNAEPHNHNDVGHFIYEAQGTAFLADLGAGEYTRDYFGTGRYEILCNNAFGHSVPILGGKPQQPGKEFACNSFDATRKMGDLAVSMDLSGAYGEKGGSIFRQMIFSTADGKLTVKDCFCFDGAFTENLITQCEPVVTEDGVILPGEKASARLRILGNPPLTVKAHLHRGHRGEWETVYAIRWTLLSGQRETGFEIELLEP